MGFTLDKIVPWGRSYEEYVAMFDLSAADLQRRILGCGDGPAAFNAELIRRGGTVVSLDPIYAVDTGQIQRRIAATSPAVLAQLRDNHADYVWDAIPSVEALGRLRRAAMDRFIYCPIPFVSMKK
jgi:hypothetical protein